MIILSDAIKSGLYTLLTASSALTSQLATITGLSVPAIYPGHITEYANPVFPCVTMMRKGGGLDEYHISVKATYQIDVWSKSGNDELWNIYNALKNIINLKKITSVTNFIMRELNVNDDLFEEKTKTYHLSATYKIQVE